MKSFNEKFKQFLKSGTEGFRFGHYYLEGRLAHGGMAEVFVGRDLELGEASPLSVIKCILPDLAGNTDFLAMFLNEAQLAAQMEHDNIVKVLDFGEYKGLVYMAMEFVDGMDCWRFTRRGMPIGDDRTRVAVYIVSAVLDALSYAHDLSDVNGHPLNVVHRDLSPSNIYLSRKGDVKLGDFGIAEIKSSRYRQISYIPQGKFGYVSPEQLEGGPLDRRSDIFAMGIVLAELLLGKKVFKGISQLSVMLELKEGRFDTIEQNKDRIPKDLLDIIYRALARAPEHRFATADDFKQCLTDFIGHETATPETLSKYVTLAAESLNARSSMSSMGAPASASDDPGSPTLTPGSSLPPPGLSSIPDSLTDEFEWDTDETPITRDLSLGEAEWSYSIRMSGDRTIGPFSFADIMELIYRNDVDAKTLVSLNGSPFIPADQYPELQRHIPVYTPTLDVNDVENPDKRGVFTVEAPAEAILALALAEETGLLVCKRDMSRKEVYFQNGKPIYVSSNDPKELLGEYLVSKGTITRSDLDMALEVLPKFDGHMGDTLIAMGMISAIDLFRSIGDQMRDRFLELLIWRLGVYEFYRNILCRQNAPEIPLDPYAFVCEGLMSHTSELNTDEILSQMEGGVISRSPRANDLLRRLSLSSRVGSLLWDLTEPTPVSGLKSALGKNNSEEDLVAALYLGLETGVWVIEGAAPPWRQ